MKNLLCAVLAALMLMLAACGTTSDSETEIPSTEGITQSTDAGEETASFEELTLANDENVTVKITAIDESNFWGYTLKVFLENKTDKELMFTVGSVSVNGFMCDPFWAATVAPGMKANEDISFSESDFENNGIEAVEQITLTLRVFDNENWLSEDLVNMTVTVNP